MEIKSSKLWQPVPNDFRLDNELIILKGNFVKNGKQNKTVTLAATEAYLYLYKKVESIYPSGKLSLDFDTKFEILRTQKAKQNEDDDDQLGDIIGLNFSRDGVKKVHKFSASEDQIKLWRTFLSQHINQMEFHHMFKVYKKIGKGNFASVYLAERIEDGLEVAVKAFSKQIAYAEENGKEAIVNEINLMRRLNQKNIMKLYEVYETSNSLYMCLELLEGGSLYEQLKNKVILSSKQIQTILFGLISGLEYMHAKDIMHRDLKLENLVFKKQNNLESIVIADFGLATRVNEKVYLYCRCGTPGYVAPEVINVKDMKTTYSSVCDVYSAGLIFHLLLTGKGAFTGKSYNTVVKLNKDAKMDFKAKIFEMVPPQALELLKQMLEKDPKKRITAAQCLQHSYFQSFKAKLSDFDYVEEDDSTDIDSRMMKMNEDSAKFDMMRINQLQNSPIRSPALNPTRELKKNDNVDPDNFMHMRSPVITGRNSSVENSPLGKLPQVDSPMNSPGRVNYSKFKQAGKPESSPKSSNQAMSNYRENALYKYALKKSTQQSTQQQKQPTEESKGQIKQISKNLSQNI